MTQIFQVVAAEAPQLVDHANRSLYGWVLAFTVILMFGGLAAGFYSIAAGKFKEKPASIIGTVVTLLTVVGIVVGNHGVYHSRDTTRDNIAHAIESKYGVKVLDPKQVFDYSDLNSVQDSVTHAAIPATDPEGKRIKITIELIDNETDVIAFSSGAEMPKIKS